jgi:hypothetical protein
MNELKVFSFYDVMRCLEGSSRSATLLDFVMDPLLLMGFHNPSVSSDQVSFNLGLRQLIITDSD